MRSQFVLELKEAKAAIAAGHQKASENGWRVTVAVVDDSGTPIAVSRMDGASPASVDTAIEKARSAAMTGLESKLLEDIIRERPGVATMKRVAVEGAVPILFERQRLGGIGVSGVMSHEDAEVAQTALIALKEALRLSGYSL